MASYASTGTITSFLRTAHCIYSDNKKTFEIKGENWNTERQWNLDSQFMQKYCPCERCTRKREDRERLIQELQSCHASPSLIERIG